MRMQGDLRSLSPICGVRVLHGGEQLIDLWQGHIGRASRRVSPCLHGPGFSMLKFTPIHNDDLHCWLRITCSVALSVMTTFALSVVPSAQTPISNCSSAFGWLGSTFVGLTSVPTLELRGWRMVHVQGAWRQTLESRTEQKWRFNYVCAG